MLIDRDVVHLILGIAIAGLTGALFAGILASLRLLRMTEWNQRSLLRTWKAAKILFLEYMACEAIHVAVAGIAVVAIGPTRPVEFDALAQRHQILTWMGFGALMSLFGTRLVSGAVERLFPELDESATKQQERWRSKLEIRAGEFASARRSLLRRIVDIHFKVNSGPLEEERNQIRRPIVWAIDHGLVKHDAIQSRFETYLAFVDMPIPGFFRELVDQIARGGVEEGDYAVTMVEKIVVSGHGVALQSLAEDCKYLQDTEQSRDGANGD